MLDGSISSSISLSFVPCCIFLLNWNWDAYHILLSAKRIAFFSKKNSLKRQDFDDGAK